MRTYNRQVVCSRCRVALAALSTIDEGKEIMQCSGVTPREEMSDLFIPANGSQFLTWASGEERPSLEVSTQSGAFFVHVRRAREREMGISLSAYFYLPSTDEVAIAVEEDTAS